MGLTEWEDDPSIALVRRYGHSLVSEGGDPFRPPGGDVFGKTCRQGRELGERERILVFGTDILANRDLHPGGDHEAVQQADERRIDRVGMAEGESARKNFGRDEQV